MKRIEVETRTILLTLTGFEFITKIAIMITREFAFPHFLISLVHKTLSN